LLALCFTVIIPLDSSASSSLDTLAFVGCWWDLGRDSLVSYLHIILVLGVFQGLCSVGITVSGPNTIDVDHSSEGYPVHSKAAASVWDLIEQVKTLDRDSSSSSDSDSSGIEIVDKDINEAMVQFT
jgi:hypothetical protein